MGKPGFEGHHTFCNNQNNHKSYFIIIIIFLLALKAIPSLLSFCFQSGQPFKFSVLEICDRIKEEFQFLQAQYHSLKLECEKLATEKTEMQRHYVMYYEMSYGLNIEMHKQAEIVKRLTAICAQITPFLTQEHQQQVLQAMDRAKLVTMGELNNIIGVSEKEWKKENRRKEKKRKEW
uniref:Groucho/TLE N-terminal Q-rich domain-containing protein n=1 Tax=Pseudonaja textilis TaxID=8673 RepID=A0A670XUK4_PSETE